MEWADELRQLRAEADSWRSERAALLRTQEEERDRNLAQLKDTVESLKVEALLEEMNRQLLDQKGRVEVYRPWEEQDQESIGEELPQEDEQDEEPEGADEVVSAILVWEEEGAREITVDIGMGERGPYLHVNGADIRVREEALRQALTRAFREELEM